MVKPTDDIGESTITLPDDGGGKERRFYIRLGAVLLLVVLGYLVWRIVSPLWQPLLWAVLLGSLLAPFNSRLTRRLGNRPRLASAITTLLAVTFFLLPVAIIAGAVTAQAAQLLGKLNSQVPQMGNVSSFDLGQVPWLQEPLRWLDEHTSLSVLQLQDWLIAATKRVLQTLASTGGTFVLGALGTLVSFVLMLFVLFFVLRDGPEVAQRVVTMLPIEERRRTRLSQHLADVTRAVFMGIGLTALVQGTLVGIGFWIAGLPSPLVFGVLGALFALVPVVGTVIVWGPAAAWLALHGDHGHAIFLALWGMIAVGSVDNFLRPLLISGRSEVPTLAVFVGVMGGLSAFGFIGLFLGPIVLGLLVALFRFESEEAAARASR
ncbi:MAG: AI-2E family transporter [Gammaproteobacteria bacterium]|nr:AI-2E family transporter [Gammaproteobacteria bacterium]